MDIQTPDSESGTVWEQVIEWALFQTSSLVEAMSLVGQGG
jgi:hypothetical protein